MEDDLTQPFLAHRATLQEISVELGNQVPSFPKCFQETLVYDREFIIHSCLAFEWAPIEQLDTVEAKFVQYQNSHLT